MKNAISPEPPAVPSNIIFFPGHHCGSTGAGERTGVRIPPSTGMKSGASHMRMRSWFPSQSEDILSLISETREILTRYSGVRAAISGSRDMALFSLPRVRAQDHSFQAGEAISNHRHMKISSTQAQMAELFALKRQEKPPENFLRDFIEEFHRRIDPPQPRPRKSASKRKASRSS